MERKRYFTIEQRNKMIKEQNKRIKIELVKENVYLKDLLMQQKEVLDKIKEYITSYESINTIQECEMPENNIELDEKTFIEMVNRYMKVHDKILELLEEIE